MNNNELTDNDFKQLKYILKSIYDIESIPKRPFNISSSIEVI